MQRQSARRWIWTSLALQGAGYLYDAVWHGLLNPGAEPQTTGQMVRHLLAVHLPLYVGAAAVLIAATRVLLDRIERSSVGIEMPVAFAGAVLSAGAEVWHASAHLRLDLSSAPSPARCPSSAS